MEGRCSKEAFFKELDGLDNLSDGSETSDVGDIGYIMRNTLKNNQETISVRVLHTKTFQPTSLLRADSAPGPSLRREDSDEVIIVKETPREKATRETGEATMKRSNPEGSSGAKRETAASKKRRVNSFNILPESQQIFKGLTFCMLKK